MIGWHIAVISVETIRRYVDLTLHKDRRRISFFDATFPTFPRQNRVWPAAKPNQKDENLPIESKNQTRRKALKRAPRSGGFHVWLFLGSMESEGDCGGLIFYWGLEGEGVWRWCSRWVDFVAVESQQWTMGWPKLAMRSLSESPWNR